MNYFNIKKLVLNNIINFLLIGLLTVVISNYFNKQLHNLEIKFNTLQHDRIAAEHVFEKISKIMSTRLFRMKNLLWHYRDPQYENERTSLRSLYRKTLDEWNVSLSMNANFIELRFGKFFREKFENVIHKSFVELHLKFANVIKSKDILEKSEFIAKLYEIELEIGRLSKEIDNFNLLMLKAIDNGEVGKNRK